jgi:hypothetical protein
MQTFPSAMRASATVGNETKLGEVCWHDRATGLSGECIIRSPKCTIGSHPSCTIVLPENIAAAIHLTLTFGKRFTLLKAPYPTRINGRLVREWLIDEPVEFCIGTCMIQVVPSAMAFRSTSVVRADQLVAAATRLSEPLSTPRASQSESPSSLHSVSPDAVIDRPGRTEPVIEPEESISDLERALSRFDSIETSLDQLRTSLVQIQDAVAKVPIDAPDVSASLAEEFSQLSQNLALQISTELRSQFENRLNERDSVWNETLKEGVEALESRMQNLALKVESLGEMQGNLEETAMNAELRQTTSMEERFAGMESRLDEFANRFVESANSEASAVSDAEDRWRVELENRFEELRIHRDEIYEALESVRNEVQQFGSVAQNNFEYLLQQMQSIPQNESQPPADQYERYDYGAPEEPSDAPSFVSQTPEHPDYEPHQAVEQDYPQYANSSYSNSSYSNPSYEEIAPDEVIAEPSETSDRDSFLRPNLEEYNGGYDYSSRISEMESASEIEEYSASETSPSGTIEESPYQVDERANEMPDVDIDALSERLRRMLSNSGGRQETLESQFQNETDPRESEQLEANPTRRSSLLERFQYEETEDESPAYHDDALIQSQSIFNKSSIPQDSPSGPEDAVARFNARDEDDRENAEQEMSSYHSPQQSTFESPVLSRNHSESQESTHQPSRAMMPEREPTRAKTPERETPQAEEEEDSIESYMQKLLQRVKGGPESSGETMPAPQTDSRMAPRSRGEFLNRSNRESQPMPGIEEASSEKTSIMTADEFVPRQQIPEKKNELDALRELANNNARRAITKSDSKKMNSAILLKIAITAFSLAAGFTLLVVNGLKINPPFAGMIAAFIVAILWGIDCLKHFRLLGDVKASETMEYDRSMAVQQKNSQEKWRPTAD